MVTEFGKFLRILRVSRDESAKQMAEKLGVSASYLSAVELGKRDIPNSWEDIINEKYMLNENNQLKLRKAISDTISSVKLDLSTTDEKKKELILAMAKTDFDDETIDKLSEIIKTTRGDK